MRFFLLILFVITDTILAQYNYQTLDRDPIDQYNIANFWSKPRYNRLEGAFIHGGLLLKVSEKHQTMISTEAGYGLHNNNWRYAFGLEKRFFNQENLLLLKAEVFNETKSNEHWKVGQLENSLACFFLHEDFMNYFNQQGFRFLADKKLSEQFYLQFQFSRHRYKNMTTQSDFAWTLFGRNKAFRINPLIVPGFENSVALTMRFDQRDNPFFTQHGWYLDVKFEKTFDEFRTMGLYLNANVYIPTVNMQKVIFHTFMGLKTKSTAPQHVLNLGGLSSLRAFPDFYRAGQNLFLLQINYLFEGDILSLMGLSSLPMMDAASLGLFLDFGDAWANRQIKTNIFDDLDQADILYDGGLSFLLLDGFLRFDIAYDFSDNWRLTMRLFDRF